LARKARSAQGKKEKKEAKEAKRALKKTAKATEAKRATGSSARGTGGVFAKNFRKTAERKEPQERNAASQKGTATRRDPVMTLRLSAVVALLAVAFVAWTIYPAAAVQYREARDLDRLSEELAVIRGRNEELQKQVDRLKTPSGVEDYARKQLGLVKEGENVVVVLNAEKEDPASAVADAEARTPKGLKGSLITDELMTGFFDRVFGYE